MEFNFESHTLVENVGILFAITLQQIDGKFKLKPRNIWIAVSNKQISYLLAIRQINAG